MKLTIALKEDGRCNFSVTTDNIEELAELITDDREEFKATVDNLKDLLSDSKDGVVELEFDGDFVDNGYEPGDILSWDTPDGSERRIIAVATSDGKDGLMCGVGYVFDPEEGSITEIDEVFDNTNKLPIDDESLDYACFFERGLLLSVLSYDEDVTGFEVRDGKLTKLEVCGNDILNEDEEGIKAQYHITDEK